MECGFYGNWFLFQGCVHCWSCPIAHWIFQRRLGSTQRLGDRRPSHQGLLDQGWSVGGISWSSLDSSGFNYQFCLFDLGVAPNEVNEVYMCNVLQAGQGQAPATQALIFAGMVLESCMNQDRLWVAK